MHVAVRFMPQFFVTVAETGWLDGNHTVFGKVGGRLSSHRSAPRYRLVLTHA